MKRNISENLEELIKESNNNSNKYDNSTCNYEEASELYKNLIKDGFAKPRGNHQLSKEKIMISSISINI